MQTQVDPAAVAMEILRQLGGNRFLVMTGAKGLVRGATFLSFRLPSNFARNGINAVRIELMGDDTYTTIFSKVRGVNVATIATETGDYCDTLARTFSRVTGLDTTIGGR